MLLFVFPITRPMLQDQQFWATPCFIFGQLKWANIALEVLLTPKCSVIDESWDRLTTAFLYSSCTTIWQMTLHPSYTVASGGRHFVINTQSFMKLQTLPFSASSTENDIEQGSTSSFFCALISCSLVRRSLLTYINVGLRIGPFTH